MANIASARKRARQAEKHRQHNASVRSMVRTAIKKVIKAIESGNKTDAKSAYDLAVPVIDRQAARDHLHRNKAARHKSRLSGHIKAMA